MDRSGYGAEVAPPLSYEIVTEHNPSLQLDREGLAIRLGQVAPDPRANSEAMGIADRHSRPGTVASHPRRTLWRLLTGEHACWVMILIAVAFLAVLTARDPVPFSSDDYGQYLLHAQAIVHGQPYTDTGYLYSHFAPFTGPPAASPGLPLTLVPVVALWHPDPRAIAVGLFFVLGAFVWLTGRYWRPYDPWLGAGAALLTGTALLLGRAPVQVGTDLPFCALVWLCILLADRSGKWSAWRIAVLAVCGGLAVAYRVAGAPLIPALLAVWWLRRDHLRWRPLPIAAVWGAVFGLSFLVLHLGRIPQAPQEVLFDLDIPDAPPSSHLAIVVRNLWHYREGVFTALLYPFPSNWANDAYHLIAVAIALLGIVSWSRAHYRSMAFVFTGFYALMLISVGIVDARYLWPLFPLVAVGFLGGLSALFRRVTATPSQTALAVGVAVALAAVWHDPYRAHAPSAVSQPSVRALDDTLRGLAATTPGMRVAFIKPRSLTWRTGIPAMSLFRATPAVTIKELRAQRISHVVTGDLGVAPTLTASWDSLARALPGTFRSVYASPEFHIYAFD